MGPAFMSYCPIYMTGIPESGWEIDKSEKWKQQNYDWKNLTPNF